jgi:hypothetical protein
MVQEAIADSYAQIKMLRLLILETAWVIDNSSTQEARTQIAATKYTAAKVLREVTYRAIHIMGSLGVTNLTPLQAQWANAPTMAVMDGVDEVHKVTVARNVLKKYRPHDGLWPTEYIPHKRERAMEKFEALRAGAGVQGAGRAHDPPRRVHRRLAPSPDGLPSAVRPVGHGRVALACLVGPMTGRDGTDGRHRRCLL